MKPTKYLYISILFFAVAILSVSISGRFINEKSLSKRAQAVFTEKLSDAEVFILKYESTEKLDDLILNEEGLGREGMSFFIFEQDSLVFWSDNTITFSDFKSELQSGSSFLSILSNNYYCQIDTLGDKMYVVVIHLSSDYPYQNKFLENGVNRDFKVGKGTQILNHEKIGSFPIYNRESELAFYLDFSQSISGNYYSLQLLGTIFLFIGVFFLLVYLRLLLKKSSSNNITRSLLITILVLLTLRLVLLYTGLLTNTFLLFDPYIYASKIAPSFGDLVLNTILFVFFTYLVFRYVQLPEKYLAYSFNRNAWIGILNLLFIISLLYAYYSSSSLINHSSLKIVIHNISQLRVPIIIAYVLLAMNFLGVFLIGLWIFKTLNLVKPYKLIINCAALLTSFFLLSFVLGQNPIDIYTLIFGIALYSLVGFLKEKAYENPIFSSLVLFLLLFSVYILLFTINLSSKKEFQRNKSLAISLSTEHDPIAEYFFEDIYNNLLADTIVHKYLEPQSFDILGLYEYVNKGYFSGYWNKYDFKITVCQPADSVLVNGNRLYWYPCYDFFKEIIETSGLQIPETKFYFVDKLTGLINYLGWIEFNLLSGEPISLFLELDSRLTKKPLGYPELLLDEALNAQINYSDISYAKYYKGNLISHSGDYDYSLVSNVFDSLGEGDFQLVKHNKFRHLVYKTNNESIIVVSEPEIRAVDYLVLFSYVFVFYYLTALIISFLFISQYRQLNFRDSLRNKIQFSVILILMASLLMIAGSTIFFNIRKYNQTQYRILEEKINSVYVELEHKLAFEQKLTANWHTDRYDNLGQLLVKFSDVFYSDINLYSPEGNLLATSREEVFQLGLKSEKMDPLAFYKMNNERLARFVHRENINKLSYLSAYVPFVNSQGELLAYLNLPYFTKQKELQEDITTLTVAIINIYVLLILLTIIIAIVISDQITKPLEMIQDRFRGLKLGGKYEPIEYSRDDEIGRLVNEYNKMVLELQNNIELLAKSERESAWREMAKQVAHEIKNPLTPMRLSVQQLKRSWDDKKEGFDLYLNRVTETLIEQIDNLSTIAGEFSNFAKMPIAKIEKVNLMEVFKNIISLYKAHERVNVSFQSKEEDLWVMADSDQLGRVFINIIKNGIQAIPEERKGEISIILTKHVENAIITISDNGKGIPDEIKDRLFTPNFTTKTGGMGLGLAIVSNILDSIDGTISFSTKINNGSTFSVSLPIVQK